MKERLQKFIEENGLKHWSFAARKDGEFVKWVDEQTAHIPDLSFAEKVYAACSGISPICHRGNRQTFDSIERGWRYCGRAKVCPCAAASVSASIKATLSQRTDNEQEQINAKRATTNVAKYGVVNIGQSEKAKAQHDAFYADADKVAVAVKKGKATMLATHGVDSPFKMPAAIALRKTLQQTLSEGSKANRNRLRKEYLDSEAYRDVFYDRQKAKYLAEGYEWLTPREEYVGIYKSGRTRFPFKCLGCTGIIYNYIYDGHSPVCEVCFPKPPPTYSSAEERQVGDFVGSLGFDIARQARSALGQGIELDIFVPERQIAIEYCGLYWHSQFASEKRGDRTPKDRQCHLKKHLACAAAGIRLITIFSDEWIQKREAVEDRLRHIFGSSGTRIFARKTVCRHIDHKTAQDFLEARHIQGAGTPAAVRYGLFHNEALVAVMTFGMPRRSNNHVATKGSWELYRFASDGAVIGGASKMFKAFVRDHSPKEVRTFADRRWGDGKVYEALGFSPDGDTAPAYWYVEKHIRRYNRYNFTKHSLVKAGYDPELTELEIMKSRGFDIIWDCGNMKYVWRA